MRTRTVSRLDLMTAVLALLGLLAVLASCTASRTTERSEDVRADVQLWQATERVRSEVEDTRRPAEVVVELGRREVLGEDGGVVARETWRRRTLPVRADAGVEAVTTTRREEERDTADAGVVVRATVEVDAQSDTQASAGPPTWLVLLLLVVSAVVASAAIRRWNP